MHVAVNAECVEHADLRCRERAERQHHHAFREVGHECPGAEVVDRRQQALGRIGTELNGELPPQAWLPHVTFVERSAIGTVVVSGSPLVQEARPVHRVAVEQIGDLAGADVRRGGIGGPEQGQHVPGERSDVPWIAGSVVAERPPHQPVGEREVDVRSNAIVGRRTARVGGGGGGRRSAQLAAELLLQPALDSSRRHGHHLRGERVVRRGGEQLDEGVEEHVRTSAVVNGEHTGNVLLACVRVPGATGAWPARTAAVTPTTRHRRRAISSSGSSVSAARHAAVAAALISTVVRSPWASCNRMTTSPLPSSASFTALTSTPG